MGNKELRRGGAARGGGAKTEEGGAKANLSSKESHIVKEGSSLGRSTEGFTAVIKKKKSVAEH